MPFADEVHAYHEAGHAVAAFAVGASIRRVCLERVVSERTGLPLDGTCDPIFDDTTPDVKSTTWQRLVVAYAGPMAQAERTNTHPISVLTDQTDDHDAVVAHVMAMMQEMSADERTAVHVSAWNKAYEIVTTRSHDLQAVAEALLRERVLTQAQLADVLARNTGTPIPPDHCKGSE